MDLIQNTNKVNIDLIPFLNDIIDKKSRYAFPFPVGIDACGNRLLYGLEKCPHLLIGGTTGSGKSVFLNNLILSSMINDSIIILIDIKRVEFSPYKDMKYLGLPVATSIFESNNVLLNILHEIEERYKLMEKYNCRNIEEYNSISDNPLKHVTVFIDELADLIIQSKDFERKLIRIAQISRAAGVHCVVATQRPSHEIISGLIRANFPSRVCFRVQSASNSKIILDQTGGERLAGSGDGLILPSGFNEAIRFQSPIISKDSFNEIIKAALKS